MRSATPQISHILRSAPSLTAHMTAQCLKALQSSTAALGPSFLTSHPSRAFATSISLHTEPRYRRALTTSQAVSAGPASMTAAGSGTEWFHRVVEMPPYPRGCHVVTRKVVEKLPELQSFEVGLANLFIQHTSASLTINENASPDVPLDLNDTLDRIVPEGRQYRHLDEGMDDMPAHVKSSLMGASLTIPIAHGRLALGTWQGIYLNEHRDHGGARKIVVTMQGKLRNDGRKYPSS